jgi:hypothetical protein
VTDEEFIAFLDEFGREPAVWPAHLRDGAAALLASSARARAALKAMRDMESLLALTAPVPLYDTATIAARAVRESQGVRPVLGGVVRKLSFAALGAMALAAGILVGMTPPSDTAIVGSVRMALNGGASDVQ